MKYIYKVVGTIIVLMLNIEFLYSQNQVFFETSSQMGLTLNYDGYTLVDSTLNILKKNSRPVYQEFISKDSSSILAVSLFKGISFSSSKKTTFSRDGIESHQKLMSDMSDIKVKKSKRSLLKKLRASYAYYDLNIDQHALNGYMLSSFISFGNENDMVNVEFFIKEGSTHKEVKEKFFFKLVKDIIHFKKDI